MHQKLRAISSLKAPSLKSYIVAATLVLLSSLTVTWWTWNNAHHNFNQDIQTTLDARATGARDMIANALNAYGETLNGAAGLFKAMPNVDKNAWKGYVANLNLQSRYPGLQSLVYSEVVSPTNLEAYIQARQTDTMPGFAISPTTPRDTYVLVRFAEPATSQNAVSIGYDPFTEPVRRKAMEVARDSGALSISSRLILKSDGSDKDREPGFTIYIPVYANNAPHATVAERRAALQGYISAGVLTHQLINGLLSKTLTKDSAVRIYDGTKQSDQNLIYQSDDYANLVKQPGVITTPLRFGFGNNTWTLVGYVNKNIASEAQRNQPRILLFGGIVFSFMLSGLLLVLMITRARSISEEKNKEVQEAKDSLISLASHQLRTPATGVKQFIGMVLEGYTGRVTKEQRSMLEKAYQSNERQLEVINQILHVTRADAGRLVMHKEKLDLGQIIKTTIDEHSQPLKVRGQRVIFRKSKKNIEINADRQYLIMAMDNLLSNASKYSHPHTVIRITVEEIGKNVRIVVTDKGVGIHPDDMHLLFQKFSRIDNELSVEAGGNGIGLYLCREIVAMHRGTISVESEPDKGSSFIIELPKR